MIKIKTNAGSIYVPKGDIYQIYIPDEYVYTEYEKVNGVVGSTKDDLDRVRGVYTCFAIVRKKKIKVEFKTYNEAIEWKMDILRQLK